MSEAAYGRVKDRLAAMPAGLDVVTVDGEGVLKRAGDVIAEADPEAY